MNPVEEILKKSLEIHLKKREDYTSNPTADPYENFTRSAEIASWFPPSYKGFGVLIGTKLARLGALLSTGKTPNNEALDDSFLDLVTYCALMYGYYKSAQVSVQYGIDLGVKPEQVFQGLQGAVYGAQFIPEEPQVPKNITIGEGEIPERKTTKDFPDKTCWHNFIDHKTYKCYNCGVKIAKETATNPLRYEVSSNRNGLIRKA